ncbi:MAG TPA: ABC transporter ATP-binding protein [Actinomycetota bacterium]|nr:ABC transporter ATP-binding protein [Actinomycetota bacterium]
MPASLCSAAMPAPAIEVRNLTKSYGSNDAVKGIDLTVERGEIFALLGPNGAGKTTTVEILEGHRKRSGGEVSVLGHDPGRGERAFKERIGIVLQETGVEPYLTVAEVIDLFRGYYPDPLPVDRIVELVGLHEKRDTRVSKLSGGQQRRLDVAVGLAGNPDLLFLDEPTTGFDPSARRGAWKIVKDLAGEGKTIFLTTHYMDEAQFLADRVAIIVGGRIIAEGPPSTLATHDLATTTVSFALPEGRSLPESFGAASVAGDLVELKTSEPMRTLNELTGWALAEGVELQGISVSRPSLEDVYLDLTADRRERSEAT